MRSWLPTRSFGFDFDKRFLKNRYRSRSSHANQLRELISENLPHLGFSGIGSDGNGHAYRTPAERTRRDSNVSATSPALRHFTDIVNGSCRSVHGDFEIKDLSILTDTTVRITDALDGVGKDRGPSGDFFNLGENLDYYTRIGF